MSHYKEFFDSQFIGVWSLDGKDVTVTISKVEKGEVGGQQGRKKDRKAIIHLAEFDEPMACNITNAKAIAKLHGNDPYQWVGKRITLYPTTTQFGRETVECIRVRPTVPKGGSSGKQPRREPGADRAAQNRAAEREVPPEAQAILDATDAQGLRSALFHGAAWVQDGGNKRWGWVVQQCERCALDVQAAEIAVADGMEAR